MQYSLHITFWQALDSVATALFMADTSGLFAWKPKWAVLFGTLIGFIMITIIIITTTILNSPLHRTVVCNKFVFWHCFTSQNTVHTQLSLATEHISDTTVTYPIVTNHIIVNHNTITSMQYAVTLYTNYTAMHTGTWSIIDNAKLDVCVRLIIVPLKGWKISNIWEQT